MYAKPCNSQGHVIFIITIDHKVLIDTQWDDHWQNGYHCRYICGGGGERLKHILVCSSITDLRQQVKETAMIYLVVIWIKTITSFWNMSRASAPIHMKATRLKYWMRADTVTQPPYA